ncbi:hypothetical protein Tco_1102966 [Tanacetum coccineum]
MRNEFSKDLANLLNSWLHIILRKKRRRGDEEEEVKEDEEEEGRIGGRRGKGRIEKERIEGGVRNGVKIRVSSGGNNGCSYKAFLACNPRDYDGKGGAVALTRWIEKMESMIENSRCDENQKARGRKAAMGMTWVEFKALLVEEFCPSNEIEKLKTHRKVYKRIDTLNSWNAPTMIMSAILKAEILTDEAVRYGTLTRSSDKRREVEETSKQGGS